MESTPIHGMASTRRYHNEQLHISLLKLTPYMFEFFGGLGVESTPLHDMASARQYHNEQLHIVLLKLSPYMFEFLVGLVWKVLPYMV